jgi:hypothetical protein
VAAAAAHFSIAPGSAAQHKQLKDNHARLVCVYKVLSAFTTGISLALPLFDKIINNAADSDTSFTSTARGADPPPPRGQRCCALKACFARAEFIFYFFTLIHGVEVFMLPRRFAENL